MPDARSAEKTTINPGQTRRTLPEQLILWALCLATVLLFLGHCRSYVREMPIDLRAFYSAGKVMLSHNDPYLVQPLFSVEQRIAGAKDHLSTVDPTPIPWYDLVGFSLLAKASEKTATVLYGVIMFGTLMITALCTSRLSILPFGLIFSACFFGILYEGATFGQVSPIAVAGLALATYLLRRGQPSLAAIAVALAFVQPQIGAIVAISCFLFVPQMRLALGLVAIVIIGASLSLESQLTFEYLKVLTAQAQAEVSFFTQYSATWIFHIIGFNDDNAIRGGALSTLIFVGLSLALIARHRLAAVESGTVILLPAVASILGGTYVHIYQLAVGLLAVMVCSRKQKDFFHPAALSAALFVSLFASALETHWPFTTTIPPLVFSFATAWGLVYAMSSIVDKRTRALQASVYAIVLEAYLVALIFARPEHIFSAFFYDAPHIPTMLASAEWKMYVHVLSQHVTSQAFFIFLKLPAWLATGLAYYVTARYLTTYDQDSQMRQEVKAECIRGDEQGPIHIAT